MREIETKINTDAPKPKGKTINPTRHAYINGYEGLYEPRARSYDPLAHRQTKAQKERTNRVNNLLRALDIIEAVDASISIDKLGAKTKAIEAKCAVASMISRLV